jgi:HEAT repeat protein
MRPGRPRLIAALAASVLARKAVSEPRPSGSVAVAVCAAALARKAVSEPRPSGSVAVAVCAAALAMLAAAGVCLAHGEGGPPPPVPPETYLSREKLYPPRWSWIHWWEANRDPYLQTVSQHYARQKPEQQAVDAYRAKAVEALVAATRANDWKVRAAAVIALGKMGEQPVVDTLAAVTANDPEPRVVMPALIAMGLLDLPRTRDMLLGGTYPTDPLLEAGCGGLGLLSEADAPQVLQALQKSAGNPKAGVATISAWGLRLRPDPASGRFLQAVLTTAKSPWVASEAVLAFGEMGDPKVIPVLRDLLLATRQADAIASWEALRKHDREVGALVEGKRGQLEPTEMEQIRRHYETHTDWRDMGPNGEDVRPAGVPRFVIMVGIEKIYMNRLRASAAIALGRIKHPRAQEALLEMLALQDDKYTDVPKGFAIMSLGMSGDEKAVPALLNHLAPRYTDGRRKTVLEAGSPLRGYAALALGLYARPRQTAQGVADPPGFDTVCDALAKRVGDAEDMLEVRAAAAVGLGLTQRTECLRLLSLAKQAARPEDELLVGYILLGSAMLGDQNILKPARWLLTEAAEKTTIDGILARRAAVLALGLLETPQAIPLLMDAWHLNYHVNREVGLAFALAEAHNTTDPLVRLLGQSTNPLEQAFACQCLGELFNARRPQRLARFLNGGNYTMKNRRMMPYQALANEFMYTYLLPAFGDQWQ